MTKVYELSYEDSTARGGSIVVAYTKSKAEADAFVAHHKFIGGQAQALRPPGQH